MIQGFWGAFRFDQMVAWYFTTPSALLFLLLLAGMAFAIRFHERRAAAISDALSSDTGGETPNGIGRTAWHILSVLEFILLVWVYWVNAEYADLDWGQRAALFAVAFVVLYQLVLNLHGFHYRGRQVP